MTENLALLWSSNSSRTSGRSAASTSARRLSCGCWCASPNSIMSTGSTNSQRRCSTTFLASRPRSRPRSFNHLLGVVRGLLDWAVTYELLPSSPLHGPGDVAAPPRASRSCSTSRAARRLLEAAAALPDNPRALQRGPTYRTIFALCYGLGLRAGEAAGCAWAMLTHNAICWWCGAASSARPGSSRTVRASAS